LGELYRTAGKPVWDLVNGHELSGEVPQEEVEEEEAVFPNGQEEPSDIENTAPEQEEQQPTR
jgi:hypothetical protein